MLPIIITPNLKNKITQHLINLDSDSKYLRFGHLPNDETIINYVSNSFSEPLDKSIWFGYIDKNSCVGAIHVSINNDIAELGISVDQEYRGQKLSSILFDRALEYIKARNITKVYMQCLSENAVIQYLAKKYDMKVSSIGLGEKEANAELDISNPILNKVNNFTYECLGLVDSCIRHKIWLCTSLNDMFNMFNLSSYFNKE